jgi:hypothetical protein
VANIAVTCVPWSVTGTISGYVGDVGLKNKSGATFIVTSTSTSYLSPTTIMIDSNPGISGTYNVTVATTPTGYECTVANASGTVTTGSVNDVVVHCVNVTNVWANISNTADLATARRSHTATKLNNGSVLVVGGVLDGNPSSTILSTAELISPANSTSSTQNSLTTARYLHTSTLLQDGSVLVAGGNSGSATATAERYNELGDNQWHSSNSMTGARYNHTATFLDDGSGKVLVVGGVSGNSSLASAEIFDPAANSWATTTDIPYARDSQTATSFGDGTGRVLVVGGIDSGTVSNDAEIYDPNDPAVWSSAGTLSTARYDHTATLLPNGNILVVGGRSSPTGSAALATAEIYDPATGQWATAGSLQTARYGHTATLRNDGTVLISGGIGSVPVGTSELFDGITGKWLTSVPQTMPQARKDFTATVRDDGTVLVVGGTAKISNVDTTLATLIQFSAAQ